MSRSFFLLLSFLFFAQNIFAQRINTSEPERLANEVSHFSILGQVGNDILVEKYGRNYFEMNAYSLDDLELRWSKQIDINARRLDLVETVLTENGAYTFYQDKKDGKERLLVQAFDFRFRKKGDPLLVFESIERNVKFRITTGINRQFIVAEKIENLGNDGTRIEITELRQSLQKVQSHEINIDKNWKFVKSLLGLNGELVVEIRHEPSGFLSNNDGIDRIKFIELQADTPNKELIFEMEGEKIMSYQSAVDWQNSQILVAGILTRTSDTPGNVFFAKSPLKEIAWQTQTQALIGDEVLERFNRKTLLGSNRNRLNKSRVRKVLPRNDGGLLLISELYEASTVTNTQSVVYNDMFGSMNNQAIKSFEYDDILLVSLSKEGAFEWSASVSKRQYSEDDSGHFSSFEVMNLRDDLVFIFNESIEYQTPLNSFSVEDATALSGIKTIYTANDYNLLLSPRHAQQINENTLIIPAYTSRNYFLLAKLEY